MWEAMPSLKMEKDIYQDFFKKKGSFIVVLELEGEFVGSSLPCISITLLFKESFQNSYFKSELSTRN
jgi:hypothetical protein